MNFQRETEVAKRHICGNLSCGRNCLVENQACRNLSCRIELVEAELGNRVTGEEYLDKNPNLEFAKCIES